MPKIKKVDTYINRLVRVIFDLNYSTSAGTFYTRHDKIDGVNQTDFSIYCNVLFDDKEEQRVDTVQIRPGYMSREICIVGSNEKELEENVKEVLTQFLKTKTTERKVIYYEMDYDTPFTKRKSGFRGSYFNGMYMKVDWKIGFVKNYGGEDVYFDSQGRKMQRRELNKMIDWTEEAEKVFKDFEISFDKLIKKIAPFFEEEGKILEINLPQLKAVSE